jgi:hypothetical protein
MYPKYCKKLVIPSVADLERTIMVARYFNPLPALFAVLKTIILNSDDLKVSISTECERWLEISKSLRNRPMFTEALIYSTGPWIQPKFERFRDPTLKKACLLAYYSIWKKVGIFFEGIWAETLSVAQIGSFGINAIARLLWVTAQNSCVHHSGEGTGKSISLPRYFSKLRGSIDQVFPEGLAEALDILLGSNLTLTGSNDRPGQPGMYQDTFLCAEIDDEDLPWDVDQTDWDW